MSTLDDLAQALSDPKAAAASLEEALAALPAHDGQLTFPEVRPPVRIPLSNRGKPVAILGACKEAALDADWSLARWVEFRKTCDACLTAAASPEEMGLFMKVVSERFDVTE